MKTYYNKSKKIAVYEFCCAERLYSLGTRHRYFFRGIFNQKAVQCVAYRNPDNALIVEYRHLYSNALVGFRRVSGVNRNSRSVLSLREGTEE